MMRRLCSALMSVFVCLFALLVPVSAVSQTDIDLGRRGSISISAPSGVSLSGAEFTIYQVATIQVSPSGPYEFVAVPAFSRMNLNLSNLENADYVATVGRYIASNSVLAYGRQSISESGTTFRNLPLGIYYVTQSRTGTASYSATSYLATVPGENADGSALYDVSSYLKIDYEVAPEPEEPPVTPPTPTTPDTPPPTTPPVTYYQSRGRSTEPRQSIISSVLTTINTASGGYLMQTLQRINTAVEDGTIWLVLPAVCALGMLVVLLRKKQKEAE